MIIVTLRYEPFASSPQLLAPSDEEMNAELNHLTPCQQRHADPESERSADVRDEVVERVARLLDDLVDDE